MSHAALLQTGIGKATWFLTYYIVAAIKRSRKAKSNVDARQPYDKEFGHQLFNAIHQVLLSQPNDALLDGCIEYFDAVDQWRQHCSIDGSGLYYNMTAAQFRGHVIWNESDAIFVLGSVVLIVVQDSKPIIVQPKYNRNQRGVILGLKSYRIVDRCKIETFDDAVHDADLVAAELKVDFWRFALYQGVQLDLHQLKRHHGIEFDQSVDVQGYQKAALYLTLELTAAIKTSKTWLRLDEMFSIYGAISKLFETNDQLLVTKLFELFKQTVIEIISELNSLRATVRSRSRLPKIEVPTACLWNLDVDYRTGRFFGNLQWHRQSAWVGSCPVLVNGCLI